MLFDNKKPVKDIAAFLQSHVLHKRRLARAAQDNKNAAKEAFAPHSKPTDFPPPPPPTAQASLGIHPAEDRIYIRMRDAAPVAKQHTADLRL